LGFERESWPVLGEEIRVGGLPYLGGKKEFRKAMLGEMSGV